MCIAAGGYQPPPSMPTRMAQSRLPDRGQTRSRRGRETDRLRAAADTILTGPQGVDTFAPTNRKTLLGQ